MFLPAGLEKQIGVLEASVEARGVVHFPWPTLLELHPCGVTGRVMVKEGRKFSDPLGLELSNGTVDQADRIEHQDVRGRTLHLVMSECRQKIKRPFKNGGVQSMGVRQVGDVLGSKRALEARVAHLEAPCPIRKGERPKSPLIDPVAHLLQVHARQVERDRTAANIGLKRPVGDGADRLDNRPVAWGLGRLCWLRPISRAGDTAAHVRDDRQHTGDIVSTVQVPHEIDDGATRSHAVVVPDVFALVDLEGRGVLVWSKRARVPSVMAANARRLKTEATEKFRK